MERTPVGRTRRVLVLVGLAAGLGAVDALPARASWKADTGWVTPGAPVSAGKLKALLDEIDARLTRVEVRTHGTTAISSSAVYCGATASTVGDMSDLSGFKGYAGAKAACEALSDCKSSKTAHVCSGEEVVRSAQIGITMPAGWLATGAATRAVISSGSTDRYVESADCQGFKVGVAATGVSNWFGTSWDPTGPAAKATHCGSKLAVLCCD